VPSLKKHGRWCADVADDDVDPAVAIEIRQRERVRGRSAVVDRHGGRELATLASEVDGDAAVLVVDGDEVQQTVTIQVRRLDHANGRIRRGERNPSRFRVRRTGTREVHITLTAIAIRHDEIDQTIAVDVGRGDRRRGRG
jgi:hypothetical protein